MSVPTTDASSTMYFVDAPLELDLGLLPVVPRKTPAVANLANRPWPLTDLLRAARVDVQALAEILHVDETTVYRRLEWGLTDDESDDWACAAGIHPTEAWGGDWIEAHMYDPEALTLLEDL